MRPEEEVLWVHARRVIALVANEETLRNFSNMQTIRDPVRAIHPATGVLFQDAAVTKYCCPSLPEPAVVLSPLVDFLPEALF